ncbi:3-methylcrotonyl-CoA carboxylase alpha subunit [Solimonas aquatica]|uniref:Biotin carboxylase n=1 Tax=Solimonas aquatica TaxID=489703 RepID=A0A1H9FWQ6_9GAMM|nr:acetyl/propionyl/methylcrotonyl-CoA carboxylase subunit alpha [Solimonas aquatica]SEQ42267.1 3-methylcrotonyl-CoA carboxylase alpha subunit [Solimonas aquatica]
MTLFSSVLIANRGEIACRVIKTCRRLGIRSIAIYSEADAGARHVRLADEAHCVGPAPTRESYLHIAKVIAAAKASGAQAIHPGYGFLSENEAFAQACAEAGIVFIGPPVAAIRAMGSKSAAKQLMQASGVPLVPGYHGDEQDAAFLQAQARQIGYPVLIKASAGGGGKGMRVVTRDEDFAALLASCQREAQASFGDARVLLEKYLQQPRHIEIQVFGDTQGHIVHLHERDCSAQRRHQKVVEEAPAPHMSAEQRAAMGRAACEAARAVNYVGAGTVEFIAEAGSSAFYFMEMNTRLQVEHPVTEMITGQDLVEWQLRVAAGEPLPLTQEQIPLRGHAIEVRIYAEDPVKNFLPSIGRLQHFATPPQTEAVRLDSGIEQGDEISPHYDPMLAKLIVWGEDRAQAVERMLAALGQTQIVGLQHNLHFLARLIDHAQFHAGTVDTGLIERELPVLLQRDAFDAQAGAQLAALWQQTREAAQLRAQAAATLDPHSPWALGDGWRLNATLQRELRFLIGEQEQPVRLQYAQGLRIDGLDAQLRDDGEQALSYRIGTRTGSAQLLEHQEQIHLFADGRSLQLKLNDPLRHAGEHEQDQGGLAAPMPGKIIALLCEPGATVEAGAPLLVMEAMKMEHTLKAPARGLLRGFHCALGEQVAEGTQLVDFSAE